MLLPSSGNYRTLVVDMDPSSTNTRGVWWFERGTLGIIWPPFAFKYSGKQAQFRIFSGGDL